MDYVGEVDKQQLGPEEKELREKLKKARRLTLTLIYLYNNSGIMPNEIIMIQWGYS